MALTFLSPAFLWLLAALPLVVVLHFLRSRRRQLDVSALFLWQRAKVTIARRRIFSPTWLLVAQLAFTALAAFALARPALVPRSAPDRVVIIDVSASLAASAGAGTRFDLALAEARPLLAGVGRLALIRAGLDARLELPLEADETRRFEALAALRPGDATSDMGRALALAQTLLPNAEVHIVTDQDLSVGRAVVHTVGAEAQNVGISALDIGIGQVFVAVVASGSRPVEVEVGLFRDGARLASGSVLVPSNGTGSITFPLEDLGGIIEAQLTVPAGDALALDDVAYTGSRPVTVVTDDDHGALTRALEAVPNTSVRFSIGARLVQADLRVLTRGFVGEQSEGNYLIFAPAAAAPVYQVVRDWDRAHPLLRFVDLRDLVVGLDPDRAPLDEADGWQVLARTADLTPVLRVRDAGGIWEVEAAFHPSQTDLILRPAFPALITNVVGQIRTTTRIRLGEGLPGTALAAEGAAQSARAVLEPGIYGTEPDGADAAGEVVLASLLSPGESRLGLVGAAVPSIASATAAGAVAGDQVEGAADVAPSDAPTTLDQLARRQGSGATTTAYVLIALALAALIAEWLMFSGVRVLSRDRRRTRAA
jgi:hypothetical protein